MAAATLLSAQSVWEDFNTSNSGLGYDWVNDIAVSEDGVIWYGTEFGLFSWDGSTWTNYPSGAFGPPDEVIRSLHFDAEGNLWIGTFMGGLCRYDGSTWTSWNTSNSPLPENFVRDIAHDGLGRVWVGTTAGLAYLDGVTWMVFNMANSTIPGDNIPSVFVDREDVLWCGTINAGLCMFDGKGFINWTIANSELSDNTVLDIAQDTAGNLWIATPAGGLNIFTNSGSWLDFNVVNSPIPDNEIFRVVIDHQNRGVMAFARHGVARFDGTSWELLDSASAGLPDNNVRALTIGPDSILWAGTEAGGAARLIEDMTPSPPEGFLQTTLSPLRFWPNPVAEVFYLDPGILRTGSTDFVLSWYDLNGRLLHVQSGQVQEAVTALSLPGQLSAGTYMLQLGIGEGLFAAPVQVR